MLIRKQKKLIRYVTRAKLQNKVFSSIDDLKVVPDEKKKDVDNKKSMKALFISVTNVLIHKPLKT